MENIESTTSTGRFLVSSARGRETVGLSIKGLKGALVGLAPDEAVELAAVLLAHAERVENGRARHEAIRH